MRINPIPIAIAAVSLAAAPEAGAEEPDLLPVRQWIAHSAEVRTVRADFVQIRELRSLKRPISNPGRFWFAAPGSFRWELGEPAQTVAVQTEGGGLLVLRPAKREAQRFTREELAERAAAGGLGFLDAGFPRDYEQFAASFEVDTVERDGGDWKFTAAPTDRRTALVLRKVVFTIDAETFRPREVYLRFRDGSSVTTRFSNIVENGEVDPARFAVDLGGYSLK